MATNPYAKAPICVAQVDPETGKHTRAFHFLGAVPRAVLDAARRGRPHGPDPRRVDWAAADAAALRAYYGASWRALLTAADPPEFDALTLGAQYTPIVRYGAAPRNVEPPVEKYGGATALDFSDLDGLDDLTKVQADEDVADAPKSKLATPVYSDIAVYPEDTVYELRLKLQRAAGVAFYRQHFFFYVNDEGPVLPYRFTVDGAPVVVDWRALRREDAGARATVAGLAVDTQLQERSEKIQVAALDTFVCLLVSPGRRVTRAYYVDLHSVLPPLGAPERPNDGLAAVLRDKYQFALLYYGALVRYWPHLSPDACSLALADPARVGATYPLLEPANGELKARFAAEQPLAEAALRWRPSARVPTAVTSATVRVLPESARMRVAVRNVFDWAATSPTLAAVAARFEAPESEARAARRAPVAASKRHVTSYGPRTARGVEWFLDHAPKHESVSFAIARASDVATAAFAYMTVHPDGVYDTTADWREDDRVGFDTVVAEIARVVEPTVRTINAMGAAAFPIGGQLAARRAADLGAITASAFWPHALTGAAFRELKERFRAYERAHVIGIRGLQQSGAYVFAFRRGVVDYDTQAADYARLTDAAAAARWEAAFPGRTVRLFHRATDLRVEVLDAGSLAEFELIRRYVFSFLDGLLTGPQRITEAVPGREAPREPTTAASRRLRRLQERDPKLFDMKKYDPNATVYSVVCQAGRQPVVYSEAEAKETKRRRETLVKYWNFTENVPAYYECPDSRFPHLSFRTGVHPLGYCVPCCKKTQAAAGSHAALVNSQCAARRPTAPEDETSKSRHVLTYGKEISEGRISELPRELADGLFLDVIARPHGLYLVGVPQSVPGVPDAGFAGALACVLAGGDGATGVLAELAEAARSMAAYFALGDGAGALFPSAAALADAILDAFVRQTADLSPFGPGGEAAASWHAVLADLARHVHGVEVVVARARGDAVTLDVAQQARFAGAGARFAVIVEGPAGTYPVAALDAQLYLRVAPEDRWMVSRRTFTTDADPDPEYVADSVAAALRSICLFGGDSAPALDLPFVMRFAAWADLKVTRLANMRGLCYGVFVSSGGAVAYVPVVESACQADGTPTEYGARRKQALPEDVLTRVVQQINDFIDAGVQCSKILATTPLVDAENRRIGFIHQGLYFYHDAVAAKEEQTQVVFPYDSRTVDAAIAAAVRLGEAPAPTALEDAARTRNGMYRLFVAQFADAIRLDRNSKLRAQLRALLQGTRFDVPRSVAALRRRLAEALRHYPGDLEVVRAAVARAYTESPHDPAEAASAAVAATTFDFDRHTLARLRALETHEEAAAEIRKLMKGRVVVGKPAVPSNVYAACDAKTPSPGCVGRALVVPADRIDDMYDILAADVRNPGKAALLASVSAGVFDPLSFIQRPGEHLTVRGAGPSGPSP